MFRPRVVLTFFLSALVACVGAGSTDDGDEGTQPARPLAENACKPLAAIHPIPNCDGCTRDLCCEAVLECEKVTDCPRLRSCYQACEAGVLSCAERCRSKYSLGASALDAIDHCAQRSCAVPCETARIGD